MPAATRTTAHDHAQVEVFDEAAALQRCAADAGEARHGMFGTLRILCACRRPTRCTRFWLDGHHPTAAVHAKLAESARVAADSLLTRAASRQLELLLPVHLRLDDD